MDELMDALSRFVRATIDYERSYLNWSGPGPVTIKEKDDATEGLEKALEDYVESRITNALNQICDGLEKSK